MNNLIPKKSNLHVVFLLATFYNCAIKLPLKGMYTMNKKHELIERINKLTDEQFEQLIHLYFREEQESVQDAPADHQTFLQSSA